MTPTSALTLFATCTLTAYYWGWWRRQLGWKHGIRRSVLFVGYALHQLSCVALLWLLRDNPTAALQFALWSVASAVMWSKGHRYDRWTVVLRYPLFGIWYLVARRWWRSEWNTEGSSWIDGWSAAAEIAIGSTWGVCNTLLLYYLVHY